MGEEPKYTLAEAQIELQRRECIRWGHLWTVYLTLGDGPVSIACDRCGESRRVENVTTTTIPAPTLPERERGDER